MPIVPIVYPYFRDFGLTVFCQFRLKILLFHSHMFLNSFFYFALKFRSNILTLNSIKKEPAILYDYSNTFIY